MANPNNIKEKENEVNSLADKMKNSNIVLLVDYRGISVADVTDLRKKTKEAGAEYCVIKNNIIKRALNKNGITELDGIMDGPTAVIMTDNEYLPALKVIYNYAKDNDFYKIKGGILEGKVTEVSELETLAQLPSREELIAKLAGSLLANVSKLAVTLDALRAKKAEEA